MLGAALLAVHRVLPAAFTADEAVRSALAAALVVVALGQPLSGYVFVVDGVLIGAGDGRWLAKAMVATLLLYLPLALGVHAAAGCAAGRRRNRGAGPRAGCALGGVHGVHGDPGRAVLAAGAHRRLGCHGRRPIGTAGPRRLRRPRHLRAAKTTHENSTSNAASTWTARV